MITIFRLLLWAAALAAIAAFAFTLWSVHRRREHRRAIETVLDWTRANVRAGLTMDAASAALLDQGFAPLIEQGADAAELRFVKQLAGYPLLHSVEVEVVIHTADDGRIAAAEHRVVGGRFGGASGG